MPAFLAQTAAMLGGILATMGVQLLTSGFLKKLIVIGLEKVVTHTQDDWDNKLLEEAKRAWGIQ